MYLLRFRVTVFQVCFFFITYEKLTFQVLKVLFFSFLNYISSLDKVGEPYLHPPQPYFFKNKAEGKTNSQMAHFSSQFLKWSQNNESTQMPIHLSPSFQPALANSEDSTEI